MKKKIATTILSFATSGVMLFGFAACDSNNEHQHVWNGGEVIKAAKCYEMGEKKYTCTVKGCGETYTEDIPMIDHSWDDGEITTDPTCKKEGVRTKKCTAEGCTDTLPVPVDKLDHVWDDGELTVIPTLDAEGEIEYTCTLGCGETYTDTVDPRADFTEQFYTSLEKSNDWSYGYADYDSGALTFRQIVDIDEETLNTWKTEGVDVEISAGWISGDSAAIGYDFLQDTEINVSVKFDGDEEETLLSAYLILVSGSQTEQIALLGGEDKDWEYASEDSLTVAAGDKLYLVFSNKGTGAASGNLKYTLTPRCFHEWDEDWTIDSEDGSHYHVCLNCGDKKDYGLHDEEGYDHTKEGHWTVCSVCGYADAEDVTPHGWVAGAQRAATFWTDSETDYSCECGETKKEANEGTALNSTDFKGDFYNDLAKKNSWLYGYSDYWGFGGAEDFEFHEVDNFVDGGWKSSGGAHVKDGWIDVGNSVTVAFHAEKTVTLNIHLLFTGGGENTRVALRYGVKDKDGKFTEGPHYEYNAESKDQALDTEITLNEGDTIYFIFFDEQGNKNLPNPWPNGDLTITLTKVSQGSQED